MIYITKTYGGDADYLNGPASELGAYLQRQIDKHGDVGVEIGVEYESVCFDITAKMELPQEFVALQDEIDAEIKIPYRQRDFQKISQMRSEFSLLTAHLWPNPMEAA